MPTYEYRCRDCGEPLEVVQSFHDAPLEVCPTCGGSLRKVFGAVGISFKGSGFYKTDSRGKSSTTSSATSGSGSSDPGSSSSSESSGSSDTSSSNGTSGSSSSTSSSGSNGSGDSKSSSGAAASGAKTPA
jgi:putative FmdB family regulatory protein